MDTSLTIESTAEYFMTSPANEGVTSDSNGTQALEVPGCDQAPADSNGALEALLNTAASCTPPSASQSPVSATPAILCAGCQQPVRYLTVSV